MSALGARTVCNMGASLYEPINVYKLVAPNIGIVDGPFEYLTVGGAKLPLPFTTRMTVVRLSNGELFLHSPVKFEARLANELLGLGAVRHLVSQRHRSSDRLATALGEKAHNRRGGLLDRAPRDVDARPIVPRAELARERHLL